MVSIKCLLKHQILTQNLFLKKTLQKLISEMSNYLIMFNFNSNGNNSRVMLSFFGSN